VITVNSTDSYHAACVASLGIIEAPRSGVLPSIAAGDMVEILPQYACAAARLARSCARPQRAPPCPGRDELAGGQSRGATRLNEFAARLELVETEKAPRYLIVVSNHLTNARALVLVSRPAG
jgi:uncharacterized protein YlaN (UPF0358 family)